MATFEAYSDANGWHAIDITDGHGTITGPIERVLRLTPRTREEARLIVGRLKTQQDQQRFWPSRQEAQQILARHRVQVLRAIGKPT